MPEQNYVMNLKRCNFPCTPEGVYELTEESLSYRNSVITLQNIVSRYSKAIDVLMDIDMEYYPEEYDSQEKVCHSLVKLYYTNKDELYSHLSHLDIYNADIEGMSSRNGMISEEYLWME